MRLFKSLSGPNGESIDGVSLVTLKYRVTAAIELDCGVRRYRPDLAVAKTYAEKVTTIFAESPCNLRVKTSELLRPIQGNSPSLALNASHFRGSFCMADKVTPTLSKVEVA